MFLNLSAPISLQWELTDWCNYLCNHCYNYWRSKGRGSLKVSPELLQVYEKTTEEVLSNRIFEITLTGGEPLSVLKWAFPFMKRLSEGGVQLAMNTNLSMLTPEKADMLHEVGVQSLLTSMMAGDSVLNDSIASTPGAHKKTAQGIKLALDAGFWVGVNMVITKKNLSEVFETARFVSSLGVENFSATKAAAPANCQDFEPFRLSKQEFGFMLDELIRVRSELGMKVDSLEFYPPCAFVSSESRLSFGSKMCTAGKIACTVGFDGEIRPCSHAPMSYGHINDGLSNVWENLQPWRTDTFLPEQCESCPHRFSCGGGCKTEAYVTTGSLNEPDPYCTFSVPPLQDQSVKVEDLSGSTFVFSPLLKFRQEAFGGIIYLTPRKWIPASGQLYNFAKEKNGQTFLAKELAKALNVSTEKSTPTVELLLSRNLIKERR